MQKPEGWHSGREQALAAFDREEKEKNRKKI